MQNQPDSHRLRPNQDIYEYDRIDRVIGEGLPASDATLMQVPNRP